MPDFDTTNPKPHVTNPKAFRWENGKPVEPINVKTVYPKHLHHFDAQGERVKDEFLEVNSTQAEADARAQGWSDAPPSRKAKVA